jgi:hypothetical protein
VSEWASEEDAIAFYELSDVEHCGSCHADAEDGCAMLEVELPDGRVCSVCCAVNIAIRKKANEKP